MPSRSVVTHALVLAALAGCKFDPAGLAPGEPPVDAPGGPGDDAAMPADGGDVDPDASTPAVRFRKALTIAAGTVDAALADFPLYVELTDGDLAARASAAGDDLHFVAADGSTVLDHEVQAWDEATGHLEAWVRLPSLPADASTTIYLRYGAFASPPAEDPAGVWQNGFVAVWHLDDTPQGGAGDITDAAGAADATSVAMNASNRVAAVLGDGLTFDGNTEQLTFTSPLTGATPHTFSAWVEQDTVAHNSALVVIGTGACAQARWLHARFTGGPVAAGFYCDDWATTNVDVQADGWTLVHWTYSGTGAQSRLYRDGELAAGPFTHLGTQSTVGTAGYIGNAPAAFGNPMGLLGTLDEVRIADVARSAAWIAAEHANQREPAAFYAVGAEQGLP